MIELPGPDVPLDQGDILDGLALFSTELDAATGEPRPRRDASSLGLILSRPCVMANKPLIVVGRVKRFAEASPRDIKGCNAVLDYLRSLRDGVRRPDNYYVGHLPGREGRYFAAFDSLHTIQVPTDDAGRAAFVAGHRIATLTREFKRDLHTRLFAAFAVEGFDDTSWFTDSDLAWLIESGRQDLLAV